MRRRTALLAGVLTLTAAVGGAPVAAQQSSDLPGRSDSVHSAHDGVVVIGHRGASGYRPEHTLASYRLAIALGADYVEPDLVSTKDGVLVARHENEIGGTTDVAAHPEFTGRRTTKTIDGRPVTGWFTEDFTLRELKTLRTVERLPAVRQENTLYNGRYEIPTFQEVVDLVRAESRRLHRVLGVYPETKHPSYFDAIGLSLEEPLVSTLRRNGLNRGNSPVFVQSFEVGNLRQLDRMTDVPLVQLVDASGAPFDFVAAGDPRTYSDMVTPAGLREIARYAEGIGVNTARIIPLDAAGVPQRPTTLIRDAHRIGLAVHGWTFRNENQFLPTTLRTGTDPNAYGAAFTWFAMFLDLGIDGVFSDNPDTAREAVDTAERPAA